jgi:hypothetical protein
MRKTRAVQPARTHTPPEAPSRRDSAAAADGSPGEQRRRASARGEAGGGAAARPGGGGLDPSLLELPGNSEATIRLLKARIRSLEEQLQAAVDCAAGAKRALLGHRGWRGVFSPPTEAVRGGTRERAAAPHRRALARAAARDVALAEAQREVKALEADKAAAAKAEKALQAQARPPPCPGALQC